MKPNCVKPDKFTILCILKGCRSFRAIEEGRQAHQEIIINGFDSDLVTGNCLIDMYSKCGSLKEARKVFDKLPHRDVISWGTILVGYAQHGHSFIALELFNKMQQEGINPSKVVYSCILKACGSLGHIQEGRLIHHQIIGSGLESDLVVGNTLLDMYVKCGSLEEACIVFDKMPNRDVVSWGSVIAGCAEHGQGHCALHLFEKMQHESIMPNTIIFSCTLKACASAGDLKRGKLLHEQIIRSGLQSETIIGSSLVNMYAKCGSLEKAHAVFEDLPDQDVVSWGAMISGYIMHGHDFTALDLFEKMQQEGIIPNDFIFSCILKACGNIRAIRRGRCIHDQIVRSGGIDIVIGNTLIDMYVRCASLEDARKVFDKLQHRDTVSWGAMIAGYVHHGEGLPAVELFQAMQTERLSLSKATVSCILKACGSIGVVGLGRLIHEQISGNGLEINLIMGNTLVDMYARCGSLEEAHRLFNTLPNRDVVSWGAIISGYAAHGNIKIAGDLLEDMQRQGLKTDDMIFTSLLSACSHMGLLEKGCQFFQCMMREHGLTPTIEHYACIVDLLGRTGCLQEATDFLSTIPTLPDVIIYTSLLTSSRICGNVELGRHCFDHIIRSDPSDASAYMLMSNIYCDAHMWKYTDAMQGLRKCESAPKKAGKAWVEANNRVQEFVVGGKLYTQSEDSNPKLKRLSRLTKRKGHIPHLDLVLEPVLNKEEAA